MNRFLAVLSAYAVFIGPLIGILCVNYYIIQQRKFHIPDLFEGSSRSLYWYNRGVNWRTVAAWLIGTAPRSVFLNVSSAPKLTHCSLPGFAASVNPSISVSQGATNFYNLTFIFGFCICKSSLIRVLKDD
jgi:NCS1 family nucleobase:cation symporter-1